MIETEIEHLRRREAELEAENAALRTGDAAGNARALHYLAVVESVIDFAMITIDQNGRITDWNKGAERILGWTAEEMRSEPIDRLYTPEDQTGDRAGFEMRQALETGCITDQLWYLKKDGSRLWASGEMMPLRSKGGVHFGFLKTLRDRTEMRRNKDALREQNELLEQRVDERTHALKASEERLRQAQKMEAVGQLTGGLSHDFNNLLAIISGSLELLQTRLTQGQNFDLDHYVTVAQTATKRAAALTHRLLAFSRQQTLIPKPTDVNRLIGGMVELIRRTIGPGVAVEVVATDKLWTILVDQNQLENALLNLCINAGHAMSNSGRLTIEATNAHLDTQVADEYDLPMGEYLSLSVTDTGAGMTPEVIKRAFDPFFTTKPTGHGTGLGLSMVYGFCRQSDGHVQIASETGRGTTVCLYLPRHMGQPENAETPGELARSFPAARGETVLVVDDEPTLREMVAEVLEDLGYTRIEAENGEAGLKILQSGTRIDLLVSDIGLPGGMDGHQMADAARASNPDLKVLFITGYAGNAVLNYSQLKPGMHVLTKPFAMEMLASRIKEIIAVS